MFIHIFELSGREREKSVGREEAKGSDSEGVRREKKTKRREEVREFIVRKAGCAKENIIS